MIPNMISIEELECRDGLIGGRERMEMIMGTWTGKFTTFLELHTLLVLDEEAGHKTPYITQSDVLQASSLKCSLQFIMMELDRT